jgi:putative glutathione S-transferase
MGMMVEGVWRDVPRDTKSTGGVNNGVYRAGFAILDWLERRLAKRRWLRGRQFTEADGRLFTTLVRFDAVYYSHIKCNLRRLTDYPRLWRYARRIPALPGVVVPRGPLLDFSS